ncbi:hypothetical protein BLNAU_9496 [Blattamonas nauphoetae]|uniref:Uncharacterized protein n=1 Tax=Blattamonas nauphoetae TaxID=2049346 RepID=A0ABQ9XVE4_9EUKA|nr:hypothetical protein BLNAU_9496 [Blattamonas nauphoetae]
MMSAENEPWTSALGEYSGRRGAEMEEREEDVDGVVDNDSADSRVSIQQTLHETVDTDPDLLSLFPVRLLDSSTKIVCVRAISLQTNDGDVDVRLRGVADTSHRMIRAKDPDGKGRTDDNARFREEKQ